VREKGSDGIQITWGVVPPKTVYRDPTSWPLSQTDVRYAISKSNKDSACERDYEWRKKLYSTKIVRGLVHLESREEGTTWDNIQRGG
jgi:hypothetical protein